MMNTLQIVGALVSVGGVVVFSSGPLVGSSREEDGSRMVLAGGAILIVIGLLLFGVGRATAALPKKSLPMARHFDGPGRFRVQGVDRATQADVEVLVDAANEANARAKGELKGLIVTGVERDYGLVP